MGQIDLSNIENDQIIRALIACRISGKNEETREQALELARACTYELINRGMPVTDDPEAYALEVVDGNDDIPLPENEYCEQQEEYYEEDGVEYEDADVVYDTDDNSI